MILDGHNDLLLRLWRGEGPRHLDLCRAAAAGFAGGFFAVFVPGAPLPEDPPQVPYSLPLGGSVARDDARAVALEVLAQAEALGLAIARRADDLRAGRVNAILHLEGAEPIAPDLSDIDEWYARGVRSIGLVWSRANAFGEGVPFAFPGSPDTGTGLTAAGRRLVAACNERGIVVDLAHMNWRGFFDVAELSDAPLVATHSNAHALCPSTRNLEDDQLDVVRESGGVVGVNFAVAFIREDGRNDPDTPLEAVCRHFDYLVERMGPDHVAFGSDYEGATVPHELEDAAAGLPALAEALAARGHDVDKLTHGNWLRVLGETWRG